MNKERVSIMAKKTTGRKSPLRNMINESIEELANGEFGADPRLDDAEEMTGPERFVRGQKHKDEVVIDGLLSDISGKTGYFLKLKKEVKPNEWMLMKVIENDWRKWADIETEVSGIVIEHTKRDSRKWGSGLYRVEIACKGGSRGKGYDPIDFYVNAEEEFLGVNNAPGSTQAQVVDPSVQVTSTLDMISQLMNAVKGVIPQPQDPAQVQNQIANAFQQGMQLKVSDSGNNNQMMIAMMTMMMTSMKEIMAASRSNEPRVVNSPEETLNKTLETLKTFGVLGDKNEKPHKEKTIIELAAELKALGIDVFKKDDPMEQIGKLKQIASIASDFMGVGGQGEKPSILEKIIDVLGPAVPKMIADIKATAENAAQAQAIASQNIQRMAKPLVTSQPGVVQTGEPTTYQSMSKSEEPIVAQATVEQPVMNDQVKMFFNQMYEAIRTNNKMFYPVVYTSLLQDQNGQNLLNGIVQGTANAKNLIDLLQQYGDERFKNSEFVMKSMVGYVNGFIVWMRQMVAPQQEESVQQSVVHETSFDVVCPLCQTEYSYGSEAEYLAESEENRICNANGTCQGILEPVKRKAI